MLRRLVVSVSIYLERSGSQVVSRYSARHKACTQTLILHIPQTSGNPQFTLQKARLASLTRSSSKGAIIMRAW